MSCTFLGWDENWDWTGLEKFRAGKFSKKIYEKTGKKSAKK